MVRPSDPVAETLWEALADSEPRPTLFWGRDLGAIVRRLEGASTAPLWWLAPDVQSLSHPAPRRAVDLAPPWDLTDEGPTRIVLRLPRSRVELEWRLDVAASLLGPGGELWIAGAKREGIKGVQGLSGDRLGPTSVLRTKRRCRVIVAHREVPRGSRPEPADAAFEVEFAAQRLQVSALPGCFAQGRLDDGTARLLAWLEGATKALPEARRMLDLGSGSGIIGCALAAHEPALRVDLVDAFAAGFRSSERTIERLDLGERVVAHLADVASAPRGPYDLICTNPPFHRGRHTDPTLATAFAQSAARRLAPGGRYVVVANRPLGYADALRGLFGDVQVPFDDGRYRIFVCARRVLTP